jgi:hypothetical protein
MPGRRLDRFNDRPRRALALSKRRLGWSSARNTVVPFETTTGCHRTKSGQVQPRDRGYLLDMSNHQQIRY